MRRRTYVDFVAAIAVAILAVCFSVTASYAVPPLEVVTVTVTATSSSGVVTTCPGTSGPGNAATPVATLPASCGPFSFTTQSGGTGPEVAALWGNTQNQLVVRTTVIKYNGLAGTTARVRIEGQYTFIADENHPSAVLNVLTGRTYGIGSNVSFSRTVNFLPALASGDTFSKQGFYAYFVGGTVYEDQIGGGVGSGTALSYVVPSSGSTTQNTIPTPSPQALEPSTGVRRCIDLVANNNCVSNKERLRTVVNVTLTNKIGFSKPEQATIPNGDHDIAANDLTEVQTTLMTLTAQLLLQQNTPVVTINPFDNGALTLILLGNTSFHIQDVNLTSLSFGPNGALPVSTKFADVNKDGNLDLLIKFRQPDTGIGCDDTVATLSGQIFFQGFGFLPFHATVGFGINSSSCP